MSTNAPTLTPERRRELAERMRAHAATYARRAEAAGRDGDSETQEEAAAIAVDFTVAAEWLELGVAQ